MKRKDRLLVYWYWRSTIVTILIGDLSFCRLFGKVCKYNSLNILEVLSNVLLKSKNVFMILPSYRIFNIYIIYAESKIEERKNCLSSTVSWFSTHCENKRLRDKRHLCLVIPVAKVFIFRTSCLSDIFMKSVFKRK